MIDSRNNLDIETKALKDDLIFQKVINSQFFLKAEIIFIFVSFESEVDTHRLIEYALMKGKTVCVPLVNISPKTMDAVEINSFDDLRKSSYGILEPVNQDNIIEADKIDLVLVPGLAFDKNGGRLGYGGGYYDKFFTKVNIDVEKIGLAYSFQRIDKVPVHEHDVLLDGIITDQDLLIVDSYRCLVKENFCRRNQN